MRRTVVTTPASARRCGKLKDKGFTTITNSGSALKDPRRNLGRAIMISIGLYLAIYALVGFAVSSNLSQEVIATRNYSPAAAARPALGEYAVWFTVVLGLLLIAFFDLSRIAALGIIFYLIMDIAIHWGVLRRLRKEVEAHPAIPVIAIALDLFVLSGFVWVKGTSDPLVLGVAAAVMAVILIVEYFFLKSRPSEGQPEHSH